MGAPPFLCFSFRQFPALQSRQARWLGSRITFGWHRKLARAKAKLKARRMAGAKANRRVGFQIIFGWRRSFLVGPRASRRVGAKVRKVGALLGATKKRKYGLVACQRTLQAKIRTKH